MTHLLVLDKVGKIASIGGQNPWPREILPDPTHGPRTWAEGIVDLRPLQTVTVREKPRKAILVQEEASTIPGPTRIGLWPNPGPGAKGPEG